MSAYITVRLFATLSKLTPENSDHYPIAPGTTVRELARNLNIPEKDAKLLFINNRKATLDSEIQDGDRVGIFPPVGGG
ncbi:molybdopterin synthase sulfur carrier subunit [Desulfonema ishimotonii]|uniref:Molybdopterin synthase sulfur carrier subunit n=1 Tax=Desulfonema ishimotonii TaxID=45657 RepID=A0A401FRB3_9BACT|nr:MoaD/ThiS family protein [Desulfonema ishimotonii]GBC59500.1 molybdopterin synthase sulfur carrier subunit [Desulfonema ishimotonii]